MRNIDNRSNQVISRDVGPTFTPDFLQLNL